MYYCRVSENHSLILNRAMLRRAWHSFGFHNYFSCPSFGTNCNVFHRNMLSRHAVKGRYKTFMVRITFFFGKNKHRKQCQRRTKTKIIQQKHRFLTVDIYFRFIYISIMEEECEILFFLNKHKIHAYLDQESKEFFQREFVSLLICFM